MLDTLVVVACHDRIDFLDNWLIRLGQVNFDRDKTLFLFVDTCSSNPLFKLHFNELREQNIFSFVRFDQLEKINYTTGAYWHGYNNYESTNYIFLHDSCQITDIDLIPKVQNEFLANNEVAVFYSFSYLGYPWMTEYSERMVGVRPDIGFFGPMFCIRRSLMDRIPKEWVYLPNNKDEEMAWERRWSVICHSLTSSIIVLSGSFEGIGVHFPFIRKQYVLRR